MKKVSPETLSKTFIRRDAIFASLFYLLCQHNLVGVGASTTRAAKQQTAQTHTKNSATKIVEPKFSLWKIAAGNFQGGAKFTNSEAKSHAPTAAEPNVALLFKNSELSF